MIRKRFLFYGRVQGVGFRMFCQEAALSRDVRGWVRNRPDGSVEMEAEASPGTMEELLLHIRTRHPWAKVDRVESLDLAPRRDDGEGFEIEH